jgi:multidrug efflux pump subunit AcrA (membrane-fusion protein)
VVAIPRNAVAQDGYALVWADDKTTLRAVTLGSDIGGDLVEVVSGLAPGEKVVRSAP